MLRRSAYTTSTFPILFLALLSFLALTPLLATPYPFRLPFFKPSTEAPPPQDASFPQQQHTFQPPGQRHQHPQHNDPQSLKGPLPGQERPDSVLTLRHILHHGGHKYPNLFRQLDLSPVDILLTELLTGESLTHRVKVKTTTTIKPHENQVDDSVPSASALAKGRTKEWKGKRRSQGFRSMGLTEDQSFGPDSYRREVVDAPDVTDKETIVQLSKMNYNSYTEVASPGWYDLEGNWSVVSFSLMDCRCSFVFRNSWIQVYHFVVVMSFASRTERKCEKKTLFCQRH